MDYTRTETSTPNGITITTTGASDHIGWMYLGEMYTELDVTETIDSNWNTTAISGSGTNESDNSVVFTWDANNWQILADGNQIDTGDYFDNVGISEPQDFENTWEWQDGEGVNWTVVDKQEGNVWTSTETGDNGDTRINTSSWDDLTQINTWSETVVSESKGLNFTITETYEQTGASSTHTVGTTDRIGWIPLDGIYTDVDVTEYRDANWQTIAETSGGTGKDSQGTEVAFDMQADEWGGTQLVINGVAYDPWGGDQGDVFNDNGGDATQFQSVDWTGAPWTWVDWNGVVWEVVDQDIDGVFSSTETAYTDETLGTATGDQRTFTSTWNDDGSSYWEEHFISIDKGLNFTRLETFETDGTSHTITTGTGDHIGWIYLGEI